MTSVEWLYRLLGVLAPINQRLSQTRFNLIPSNVLLLIALAAIVLFNANRLTTVVKARTAPTPQPVSAVLFTQPARNYVALEGRLAADARIDFDRERAEGNLILMDYTWVPLVDRTSGQAVLVQFDANRSFENTSEDVTIEGMLRPIMPAVGRRLSETDYVHAGSRIDRRFVLIDGRRPGSLTTPVVVSIVSSVLLLSLAWLSFNQNVVFMRSDSAPAGRAARKPAPESLLVSGTLTFDGRTRRFFIHVPASITRTESGKAVIVSLIETSRTVWHVKSVEHSGMWLLAMQPGSITDMQAGHVFWGAHKLRAVRFRFMSGLTGKADGAVIASNNEDPVAVHSVL